jgi:hypothetical protein
VLADGLAGLRLASRFFDGDEIDLREDTDERDGETPIVARRRGVAIDMTRVLRPVGIAVEAARAAPKTVNDVARGVQGLADIATSASRQVVITGGSLSPLLVDRSTTTRFEVISLGGVRAAALGHGGSRNDLLVTGAAAGLGLYHERLGHACEELRLGTPTSQRRGQDGGNSFVPARVSVPTADVSPSTHFGVVADRLTNARTEPALKFADVFASAFSRLPSQVLVPLLHGQVGTIDFAATAIPAMRGSGSICGAQIETTYPFGPRLGCPVNLTAFADKDRLDVGIALDPAAITEPAVFLDCLTEAYSDLVPQA